MKHVAAYPDIIEGRPDLDWYRSNRKTPQPGITKAKTFPKYVHGRIGMAMLLHKIDHVDLWWYETDNTGSNLVRLQSPRMIAHTVCGNSWSIDGTRAKTCQLPNPETVLCGRCEGTGTIWGRGKTPKVTKRQAKDRLGCIVEGTQI
jgi:hypothetical protein